ncbi:glutathione S-transferase U17-like [Senna tora]|uniref:Glutathione S-transferase U17-like n=1 Tax=Senna tora TaxID=362788 RepID=A0A834SSU0_9FABA|nr:glutathione S-transferase U17-like [Senna tora]
MANDNLKLLGGCKEDLLEEVEEGLVRMEDALEKCSKGKAFFGGDQIGRPNASESKDLKVDADVIVPSVKMAVQPLLEWMPIWYDVKLVWWHGWFCFSSKGQHSCMRVVFSLKNILGCEDDEARKTYFEEVEEGLVRMEDAMEKCSKGKAFFGGDQIGLVDITFGSFLSWLSVIEIMNGRKVFVEAKTPALVKWAENFGSDPNVKAFKVFNPTFQDLFPDYSPKKPAIKDTELVHHISTTIKLRRSEPLRRVLKPYESKFKPDHLIWVLMDIKNDYNWF